MALSLITLNTEYYPDPIIGKPVSLGSIYIGSPDTDPVQIGNRVNITARQEDGTDVPIAPAAQPINTGGGGTALYAGAPVQLLVEGNYSIKVLRANGTQAYYIANALAGTGAPGDLIVRYDNLADIRATAIPDDALIYVEGHTTDGDGGEGHFYWSPTSSIIDNNGTVIKLAGVTTGRYIRNQAPPFNIAMYGGFPGAQDSLSAFNAAVAYNSESIQINEGVYSVTSGDFSAYDFHSFAAVTFSDNTTIDVYRIPEQAPNIPVIAGYSFSTIFYSQDSDTITAELPTGSTIGVWESVGPSGSGETLIWTALNALPLNAVYLYVKVSFSALETTPDAGPFTFHARMLTRNIGGGTEKTLLDTIWRWGDTGIVTARPLEARYNMTGIIPLDAANKFERFYFKQTPSTIKVELLGFGVP